MSLQVLARKEGRICPSRILSLLATPVFTRPQYLPRSRHPLISVCRSVSVFIVSMDSTKSSVQYSTCGRRLKRKFIFLNILYCFLMIYSLIGWFQIYLNCCIQNDMNLILYQDVTIKLVLRYQYLYILLLGFCICFSFEVLYYLFYSLYQQAPSFLFKGFDDFISLIVF